MNPYWGCVLVSNIDCKEERLNLGKYLKQKGEFTGRIILESPIEYRPGSQLLIKGIWA